ncbi:hypothetical protein PF010_g22311 [Phytophthora fragariae]|uniref:Uncharacterized protein n=2 Tax=Phytophthora fragariae TaxID=53985 RepID=A0A6G0K8R3_9STRA|nr:hypothetical protein PF010_g22311 [Phytophthora fragariae]
MENNKDPQPNLGPKPNKAKDTLKDTDQCIMLQRSWPNGNSRRGSALYALGRYADAYRAYKNGLSREASDTGLF